MEGEGTEGPDAQAMPAQVTVIELDGHLPAASEIADVIETAAGIQVQRLGGLGDWSTVSIRGSSSRQVQIYLDGVPLNPDGASTINLAELPTTAFERVEIYRGHAPAEFNAAPMGGVVNLVTKDGGTGGGASATIGSHDTHRVGVHGGSSHELGATSLDTWIAAELLSTEGDFRYFDNNATIYNLFDDQITERTNNAKDQLNLVGRVRAKGGLGSVSLLESHLVRNEGVPGPGVAPSLSSALETDRNLAVLQADLHPIFGPVRARLWHLRRVELWDDRGGAVGVGSQWQESTFDTLGGLLHLESARSAQWTPALTGSARADRWVLDDLLLGLTDEPRTRRSVDLTPSLRTFLLDERVRVDGAMQFKGLDNRAMGDLPFQEFPGTLNPHEAVLLTALPRGGVAWRPHETLTVKANAGRYLRAPDMTELFGDRGGIIGNADLQPERGSQGDLGLRWQPDTQAELTVELAGFAKHADDLIVLIQNSQHTMLPMNLGESRLRGLEAAASLVLFDLLASDSALTRTWSENLSTLEAYAGNQLPGVPAWELHQQTTLLLGDLARIGHSYSYTEGAYWDETNWYRSAPRHLHGIFARLTPLAGGPEAELEIRNLTDRLVEVVPRNPLDPEDAAVILQGLEDFHGYPLPGRTVLFTLRWTG